MANALFEYHDEFIVHRLFQNVTEYFVRVMVNYECEVSAYPPVQ